MSREEEDNNEKTEGKYTEDNKLFLLFKTNLQITV